MSRDEQDLQNNIQTSLKSYSIAQQKVSLYYKILQNESERLFSYFVGYVKENNGEPRSFSETIRAFYYDVLNMDYDFHDRTIRSSLTKRFRKLLKRHTRDNSRNQVKLDDFLL